MLRHRRGRRRQDGPGPEFARRAQDSSADLLVAIANCNAQTGIGDPYLPFGEVLGLLTGDVEAKLTQGAITQANAGRLRNFLRVSGKAPVDLGPDLIDIFVPGSGLATRAGAFLAGKIGWLDRLEELTQRKAARRCSVGQTVAGAGSVLAFQRRSNLSPEPRWCGPRTTAGSVIR